jgi:hypothetical protein
MIVSILAFTTGNPAYLIWTNDARRVWPVSRGCSLLQGTWSYLRICRGSMLPYTRFCICFLDYDYVWHIINFSILYWLYIILIWLITTLLIFGRKYVNVHVSTSCLIPGVIPALNVEQTLNHLNLNSTLIPCWFNTVCVLGLIFLKLESAGCLPINKRVNELPVLSQNVLQTKFMIFLMWT